MKLFQWFKEKFDLAPLNRVASVTCDGNVVNLRWISGSTESVSWSDVERVVIRTTDMGPFDEDVFFILETDNKKLVIPQEAEGTTPLLERLQELPGFDNEALIESMCCTDNKVFPCWDRSSSLQPKK